MDASMVCVPKEQTNSQRIQSSSSIFFLPPTYNILYIIYLYLPPALILYTKYRSILLLIIHSVLVGSFLCFVIKLRRFLFFAASKVQVHLENILENKTIH